MTPYPTKVLSVGLTAILLVIGLTFSTSIVENLEAENLMVVQDAVDGELHIHTTPGWKSQWYGKVTKYPRRSIHPFEKLVRFNDGGHATMKGSIQYTMPVDEKSLTELHLKFGSAEAIAKQLVETVVVKSVYMTGPLMSSKESYAEKRNSLIHYVEDQVENGVYKTTQRDVRVKDPITGQEKTAVVVEVVVGKDGIERQEEAVLRSFGIVASNFAIETLDYEDQVEAQIGQQQKITMEVQTAIADAKKAEQRAITVEQQGKADAAKAKWEQETIKAKEVTKAEQELEVARLGALAAEQTKRQQILLGEGEARKQELIRQANGNLDQKLEAWKYSQNVWAAAFSNYKGAVVPSVVTGATGQQNGNAALSFMEIMGVNAARQLAVDVTPGSQSK